MRRALSTLALCLAVAAPAFAQAPADSLAAIHDKAPAELGVTFGIIKFDAFHSDWGFDGTYSTKPLSGPMSSLGFRAGVTVAGGLHSFEGERLKLVQGGLHLVADKIGGPRFQMYGNFLFGIGNYFGATDEFLTLAVGANIPLQNSKYLVRVEAAQIDDYGDGEREGGWRFSGGVTIPLNGK